MRSFFVKGLVPGLALLALAACGSGRASSVQIMDLGSDQLTLAYMSGVSSRDVADSIADDYCHEVGDMAASPVATGAPGPSGTPWVWETVTYRCVTP